MKTITRSLLCSPHRSGMSAPALLVTLASAIVALVVLALSPTAAQSSERHNGKAVELSGKTWLKVDKDTAAALTDAGVKVKATGAAEGPTAKRPYTFAFPIVGGKVDKDPLGGKIVHSGGLSFSADSKSVVVKRFVIDLDRSVLTATVAGTLNESLDTDLFARGLLIGEATVIAKIGDGDNGEDHDDNDDDNGED